MIVEVGLVVLAAFTGYEAYQNRTKIEAAVKKQTNREFAAEYDLRCVEAKAQAEWDIVKADLVNIKAAISNKV